MTDANEKRRFTRIPFEATAHIISPATTWYSTLIDISLKGALVDRPADWSAEKGEQLLLELKLENSDVTIRMDVEVAHVTAEHLGFVCKQIDLESISHLRRLVELNLGDEALLDREMSALVH